MARMQMLHLPVDGAFALPSHCKTPPLD